MWKVYGVGWLGQRFRIEEGARVLTELRLRWTREQAEFRMGSRGYLITRESRWSGKFTLESGTDVLASATKPSAIHRRFLVNIDGEELELVARSAVLRAFDLYQGKRKIGSVEPLSLWERGAVVALPDELDPAVRVFMTWLVLMLWGRSRAGSVSS